VGSGVIDIPAMTGRGFAVAAVNYRLMPEDPFPAEIQDVKCAIRFLRAHAEEYGLDTSRIGVWGGSAGGHLAAMLGLTNGDQTFEVGDYLDQSSSVDAVVEMFGPTDLTAKMGWLQRMLLRRAFGTDSPGDPRLAEASPVRYVQGDEPPFLVIHGEDDSAVPLEQAEFLYHALRGAGSPVELMVVGNANHNFKPTGGPITPDRAMISTFMGDFFAHELR
jgi:acetyl esterase/lipase